MTIYDSPKTGEKCSGAEHKMKHQTKTKITGAPNYCKIIECSKQNVICNTYTYAQNTHTSSKSLIIQNYAYYQIQ